MTPLSGNCMIPSIETEREECMKVCKFGGSSLADSGQIKKVKDIIQQDSSRRYIVVSAPGKRTAEDTKVTDLLYALQGAIEQKLPYQEYESEISQRFLTLAKELGVDTQMVEQSLEKITKDLLAGANRDYAASRGEFLNGKIIADFFGATYIEPSGLIEIADNGRVAECSYERVAQALDGVDFAVIPGFYGSDTHGNIKTFSRGGSDITGSIVARAVIAECYENWTDVSGVMMAHPGIVKNPKINSEMTFRELRELALVGASVFHEEAVQPVRSKGISIHIKNTNAPEDHGTHIMLDRNSSNHPIVGVAGEGGYTAVHVHHVMLNTSKDLRDKIVSYLSECGEITYNLENGDDLTVILKGGVVDIRKLNSLGVESVTIHEQVAIVAVVGEGVTPSTVGIFTSDLMEKHEVFALSYGGGSSIICGVLEKQLAGIIGDIYGRIS